MGCPFKHLFPGQEPPHASVDGPISKRDQVEAANIEAISELDLNDSQEGPPLPAHLTSPGGSYVSSTEGVCCQTTIAGTDDGKNSDGGNESGLDGRGRCPFNHGGHSNTSKTQAASVAGINPPPPDPPDPTSRPSTSASNQQGKCPFLHQPSASREGQCMTTPGKGAKGDGGAQHAAGVPAGRCPFGRGQSAAQHEPRRDSASASSSAMQHTEDAEPAQPATCPYGFGGGYTGPRMSHMHCVLCRSLFHDCVVSDCGHRFCRGCISRFCDCPLCGADITQLTADGQLQGVVEEFIQVHGGSPGILDQMERGPGAEGKLGGVPTGLTEGRVEGEEEEVRAALLLQLGLRAMTAGNLPAAKCRLLQSRSLLQQAAESACATRSVHSRLGALCCCLGDCCRSEGDWGGAEGHYRDSAQHLERAEGGDAEAQQALSVTWNKLGELHHMAGELGSALPLYQRSLSIRRRRLQGLSHAQQAQHGGRHAGVHQGKGAVKGGAQQAQRAGHSVEWCSAALDVAVGCVKVADAWQAVGGARQEGKEAGLEVGPLLSEAAELADEIERSVHIERDSAGEGEAGGSWQKLARKLSAVQEHLQACRG